MGDLRGQGHSSVLDDTILAVFSHQGTPSAPSTPQLGWQLVQGSRALGVVLPILFVLTPRRRDAKHCLGWSQGMVMHGWGIRDLLIDLVLMDLCVFASLRLCVLAS